ncbi:MAG TPA: CHAD domain-containing protein, partial [Candidatus Polarisedimenticolia bacterium]|nr:CHAD domain-containing protein [Candidatus Polarisedimenticolia bacterium]
MLSGRGERGVAPEIDRGRREPDLWTSVRALVERRTAEVLRAHRRVWRGLGGEAVHDLRVASRRLQETLDLLAPALPER